MFLQKRAAGALLVSQGFMMLQQRSLIEHEPLSWCNPGGMAEDWESPVETAIRETFEESGIDLADAEMTLIHTFENESRDFRYDSFLAVLPKPVPAVDSPESIRSGWFKLGTTAETVFDALPQPLHSGMTALIRSPAVRAAMVREALRTGQAA